MRERIYGRITPLSWTSRVHIWLRALSRRWRRSFWQRVGEWHMRRAPDDVCMCGAGEAGEHHGHSYTPMRSYYVSLYVSDKMRERS